MLVLSVRKKVLPVGVADTGLGMTLSNSSVASGEAGVDCLHDDKPARIKITANVPNAHRVRDKNDFIVWKLIGAEVMK